MFVYTAEIVHTIAEIAFRAFYAATDGRTSEIAYSTAEIGPFSVEMVVFAAEIVHCHFISFQYGR